MGIVINSDKLLENRDLKSKELAKIIDITGANLSKIQKSTCSSVCTLEAICEALDCQPGDILEFTRD